MRTASPDIDAPPRVAAFCRYLPETLAEPGAERSDAMFALLRLEFAERRLVYLRYVQGLPWEEVAARMGIGRKIARRIEERALRTLEAVL